MRAYGFSTGALALGDFRKALRMLDGKGATAIELSALRDHELRDLVGAMGTLDLGQYQYVSIHAPSRFEAIPEGAASDLLTRCIDLGWPIVIHPDAIKSVASWRKFGSLLLIENMDKRKPVGRTASELGGFFDTLPEARFCLDLAHTRQVDTTLSTARELLREFGDRLAHIHLSELDVRSRHEPISLATVFAVQDIAHLIPEVPIIIESMVGESEIDRQIVMAKRCFEDASAHADAGVRAH